ncbi:MAG: response regulator transcription factor [Bacteroidales bacterium]|nr:response regulator transcription factor [Bacteroidales bacterium]
MITAIALDDEPPALRIVENFCGKVDFIRLEKSFTHPHEALKHLEKFPADLLFLDIRMPSMSGVEFAKKVPGELMVIFTTAYSEYAVEGFNLNAVDYLLKPFTFERFMQAVNKAGDYYRFLHQSEQALQQYLFVRADYSLVRIILDEILYIEGLDDYLRIFLTNRKPVVARMTMKTMLEKLPADRFARVHRSFIVPVSRIDKVRNKIIFIGDKQIPIGNSYEKGIFRE